MYRQYDSYEIGVFRAITPVIKYLIIANAVIFVAQIIFSQRLDIYLSSYLGLIPKFTYTKLTVWQFFTYLFLHGSFYHILINMFVLWMFGCELERYWGSREFLFFYFLTGVGAGVFSVVFNFGSTIPVIGASGAVYGVLTAFGMIFPNRLIYLYFLIPVRAKYFVIIIGVITFLSAFSSSASGIAHFAHLGGMVIGFIYLKKGFRFEELMEKWRTYRMHRRLKVIRTKQKQEKDLKERMNNILDKINEFGYESLSEEEIRILNKASQYLFKGRKKGN